MVFIVANFPVGSVEISIALSDFGVHSVFLLPADFGFLEDASNIENHRLLIHKTENWGPWYRGVFLYLS